MSRSFLLSAQGLSNSLEKLIRIPILSPQDDCWLLLAVAATPVLPLAPTGVALERRGLCSHRAGLAIAMCREMTGWYRVGAISIKGCRR